MDWTEKYRPSSLSELRGNDSACEELREWADTWEDHREAVVLHGPPGVGKTSAAHALAADEDWPTIELNASDSRTKSVIERVAGEAARSGTLAGGGDGRRLVIMDEADNIHGNADRGGASATTSLVKAANQPVVLVANDFYEMSRGLRDACREIEFRAVSKRSILPVLRDLCRREEIEFESEALEAIAEQNSGDLRGAVKDLQALAEGRERLERADVVTGERDRTEGVFDFLDDVLKEATPEAAREASFDVDETPDDLINWIEDNLPKDYRGEELAGAFDALASADRWLGRVRATQNYSYWRYAADQMTAGVAAARDGEKGGWTRYGPPSYWSKLGRTRGTRETREYVARQIAETGGTSTATARREILPVLASMTHHCKNRELTVAMAAAYELEEKHVSFITGSGETTNKVESIVADANERREQRAVDRSQGAFDGTTGSDHAEGGQSKIGGKSNTESPDDTSGAGPGEGSTDADENDTDTGEGDADTGESDQQAGLSEFL